MKHTVLFTSLLLFFYAASYAQNAKIKGTVTDEETGEALTGASIKIEKVKGGVTDASGKFMVNVQPGTVHITVSFIGYKNHHDTITVAGGETKTINFTLKSNAIQISTVETVSQFRKNSATETVSVDVISADQIKNTNAMDLSEVISKTPGVLVQDGQISIRSGSAYSYGVGSRTLVLQDGLPLMSADLGDVQNNMVGLSNVRQVEIVKGAASAIYGSNALNGVINVLTQWPSQEEPKTEISTNIGMYDRPGPKVRYRQWWEAPPFFTNINVSHQQRVKNVQYEVGGNITAQKSYLTFDDQYRAQAQFKVRRLDPKIEGLNYGLLGSFQYERSERFFISKDLDSFALVRGSGSDDRYIRTNLDPFVSYENAKGHRITSNWRYMNIFRKGNGSDPNAVSHQIMANNQYQYKWKNMLIITTGVPFTVGLSSSNLYPGFNTNFNVALYAQGEFDYKFLSFQAGLRYEVSGVDSVIEKGRPIFRSGINLKAGRATFFRASWGQGYRVPTIGEKYIAQPFQAGVEIVPNDTLKTESNWNLELGFRQEFKIRKWLGYFDASFYWQQSNNYIEYELGVWSNYYPNGHKIFDDSLEFPRGSGRVLGLKPLNIEYTRVAGYELSIGGKGNIGPVGLKLQAGYTYTWPGTNNGSADVGTFIKDMFAYNFKRVPTSDTAKILEYRIRHLVRADVEVDFWKCYLGATFSYASVPEKVPNLFTAVATVFFGDANAMNEYIQQHIHGDYTIDLRSGIKINDHFNMGFIIKNVTNRFYDLRPAKPEPLRNYTLQFRYTF